MLRSFFLNRVKTDTIKRVQFPIKFSFAIAINKSQGSTLSEGGVYLNDAVFSHGQLYAVYLIIAINSEIEDITRNVVYTEIFDT